MLQHVPVSWENAHPIIEIVDVDGTPDQLFRTFFGGHTAYAALLACDKIGLSPDSLFFRSRAAFEDAAAYRANLPIEGRRPGLDESLQAAIRFIMHERRRHMQYVQLYSVRRALIETGTVGSLWQQRQRLMTGKDPVPLQPPPPVEWASNSSSSGASPARGGGGAGGGGRRNSKDGSGKNTGSASSSANNGQQPQQHPLLPDAAHGENSDDVMDDITAMIERQQYEQSQRPSPDDNNDTASVTVNVHSPPRSQPPPWPAVPDPAPLFRWRTKEVLDREEEFLSETTAKLVQFGTAFIKAEQSRLHEQLTRALQQSATSRPSTQGGNHPPTLPGSSPVRGLNDDDDDESSPSKSNHPFYSSKILGLEHLRRPQTIGGRPTTAGAMTVGSSGVVSTIAAAAAAGGCVSFSPSKRNSKSVIIDETLVHAGRLGKVKKATTNSVNSSHLWQLGESPFSIAGVRPPRPPSTREPLVTKFGKKIGDDYVSTTVQRHLRVIAKQAAAQIASTVHLNHKDDDIREEMEEFMAGRKVTRVTAPTMGKGFVDGDSALNDSIFQDQQDDRRKARVEYEMSVHCDELLDKMRERHERQEDRLVLIEDMKTVSRALAKEVELVRRENVHVNRSRLDHVETARRLVIRASRAGRHERVDMLREQHRAAAWNSRVSHEMEAMVRSQVKDKVKAMQLTRRWELDELPTAEELADIFHSGRVVGEWQSGMVQGIDAVQKEILYESDPSVRRVAMREQMTSPYTRKNQLMRHAMNNSTMSNNGNNSSGNCDDMKKRKHKDDDDVDTQSDSDDDKHYDNNNNNNSDSKPMLLPSFSRGQSNRNLLGSLLHGAEASTRSRVSDESAGNDAAGAGTAASSNFPGALPKIRPSSTAGGDFNRIVNAQPAILHQGINAGRAASISASQRPGNNNNITSTSTALPQVASSNNNLKPASFSSRR